MALIIEDSRAWEAKLVDFGGILALAHPMRQKIVELLSKRKMSLKEIAKYFKTSQQKIYYHLVKLRKAGIIEEQERRYFAPFLNFAFVKTKPMPYRNFGSFPPFAENGVVKCRIVVGSPDPHGKFKARARDGHIAAEVAAFFASFGTLPWPFVLTDQEVREVNGNLVLVGGPIVNLLSARFNELFPIRFDGREIVTPSKRYAEDEIGFVARASYEHGELLLVAGRTRSATRAAALALRELGPKIKKGVVVSGYDEDGDGIVDGFEVIERVM